MLKNKLVISGMILVGVIMIWLLGPFITHKYLYLRAINGSLQDRINYLIRYSGNEYKIDRFGCCADYYYIVHITLNDGIKALSQLDKCVNNASVEYAKQCQYVYNTIASKLRLYFVGKDKSDDSIWLMSYIGNKRYHLENLIQGPKGENVEARIINQEMVHVLNEKELTELMSFSAIPFLSIQLVEDKVHLQSCDANGQYCKLNVYQVVDNEPVFIE